MQEQVRLGLRPKIVNTKEKRAGLQPLYSIKEDFMVEHTRALHKGPKGNLPFVFASSFCYSALTSITHNDIQ